MKRALELTADFSDDLDLHSVSITEQSISVWVRVDQGGQLAIQMTGAEFDALNAQVDLWRKLKAQLEAA